jgi:hypothetical protein
MWPHRIKTIISTLIQEKRSMFKKIMVGLSIFLILFIGVVSMQPADFRVARSATIAAPAPAVFAQVNDLHNWEAWSPWAKLDPAMKQSYDGPSSGTGAIYKWAGNSQVGEGTTTITESRPNELVRMKLEMIRPFAATNDVEFTFKPAGDKTDVTWAMTGQKNFMAKAMGLFIDCDKMCGDQFEQGLAQLKMAVEPKSPDSY